MVKRQHLAILQYGYGHGNASGPPPEAEPVPSATISTEFVGAIKRATRWPHVALAPISIPIPRGGR